MKSVLVAPESALDARSDGSTESGGSRRAHTARRRPTHRPKHKHFGDGSSDDSSANSWQMPEGKTFHYFLSHKKTHSRCGSVPAEVAKNFHDSLALLGYTGFFDIDDLKQISKEALRKALENSCALIVLMNDETAQSEWCRYEWEIACEFDLPVKVVVDMSLCGSKPKLVEEVRKGYESLTRYQWSEFTDRHRREVVSDLCEFLGDTLLSLQDLGSSDDEFGGTETSYDGYGALMFGAKKERLLHPRFVWLLAVGGTPLVTPRGRKGRNVRVWKRFNTGILLGWLLAMLLVRFGIEEVESAGKAVYGFGGDLHLRVTIEAVICLALFLSWSMRRIVSSKLMASILRGMEDRTSKEIAGRLYRVSHYFANGTVAAILLATPLIWAAFVPANWNAEAMRISPGYTVFAGLILFVGTPFVLLANLSLFGAIGLVIALSTVGLLSSVDVLHKRISELGFARFHQVTDRRLVVAPKNLVRFNDKWSSGLENYRKVQAALAAPFAAFGVYIIIAFALPISMALRGITFDAGTWVSYLHLLQYAVVTGLALLLELVACILPLLCTTVLQRFQRRLRMIICDDVEHQLFLCVVCCDVDLRFRIVPGLSATARSAVFLALATSAILGFWLVPLTGIDIPAAVERQWWWRGCDGLVVSTAMVSQHNDTAAAAVGETVGHV